MDNAFPNTIFCTVCSVAVLETHPEEKFANLGYRKCPICGNTILVEKKISELNKILVCKDVSGK
jgi:DNA-directed RNA polymerase subunit RPC12/RpoP